MKDNKQWHSSLIWKCVDEPEELRKELGRKTSGSVGKVTLHTESVSLESCGFCNPVFETPLHGKVGTFEGVWKLEFGFTSFLIFLAEVSPGIGVPCSSLFLLFCPCSNLFLSCWVFTSVWKALCLPLLVCLRCQRAVVLPPEVPVYLSPSFPHILLFWFLPLPSASSPRPFSFLSIL